MVVGGMLRGAAFGARSSTVRPPAAERPVRQEAAAMSSFGVTGLAGTGKTQP